jgi:hypothetical protein
MAVNASPPPPLITPAATPAQTAAIMAAIESFVRDTATSPRGAQRPPGGGWLRAAHLEAVSRAPGRFADAGDRHPWHQRTRPPPTKS